MGTAPYDPRNLQSLVGYGRAAHVRSGGICQLCGCGKDREPDFDLWRQFTIEHLIGEGQGGYRPRIRAALVAKFGGRLSEEELSRLAYEIHEANVVTACQFCNSTTSRDRAEVTMEELIAEAPVDPDGLRNHIIARLQAILDRKRAKVAWKIEGTRSVFEREIRPEIERRRLEEPALMDPWTLRGLDVEDTSPPS